MTNSIFIQTYENSLQVLHDWHVVVKSFFKSTFKRHLNIYLNFVYDFCVPVSDGRKMIFHRQIDFELTHSR